MRQYNINLISEIINKLVLSVLTHSVEKTMGEGIHNSKGVGL